MTSKRYGYPCGCEVTITAEPATVTTFACDDHLDRVEWPTSAEFMLCDHTVFVTTSEPSAVVAQVACQLPVGHEGSHGAEVFWDDESPAQEDE